MRVWAQLLLTFLLNASWQVALIAAFAAVCDWLLRGTVARYRHILWVAALFLAFALPMMGSVILIKASLSPKSEPARAGVAGPVFVTRVSSPDLDSFEPSAVAQPASTATIEPARRNFLASPVRLSRKLAALLIGVYALFLLYRGWQLIRAWRRTRAIIQSAITFEFSAPVAAIVKKCRAVITVHRVRILSSPAVPVPITVGIFNPLIILPDRLLQDLDQEVLTTAIGHELVHVSRRDYLANLVYELIYLPLSFHPAVALMRRRIRQTRELCCDDSVAAKLLRPETYARSLVRLIGSAPLGPRLGADTTIGISESDILEVRIMSLLKTPKFTARRKWLLLITASLLLVAPCVVATSFALTLDFDRQEAGVQSQPSATAERASQERVREELKRAVRDLQEQKRVAPESQRQEVEARLREVQQKLAEHELLQEYNQQKREDEQKRLEELRTTLAQLEMNRPADEARLKDVREKIALMEKLYTSERVRAEEKIVAEMQQAEGDRKARVVYRVEPEYPSDAREKKIEGTVTLTLTVDHQGLPQNIQVKRSVYPSLDQSAIDAARKMRFEPAMKNGEPVSMFISVDFVFAIESHSRQELEQLEKRAAEERASQGESQVREMKMSKDLAQQKQERERTQVELTRGAVLPMDRAIQIATSQVPGKVLACSLGRDGDKLFYHVVIISGDTDKSTVNYVYVSAIDGQILKTEKEERKEKADVEVERAQISGGVLNSKADSLPSPEYPQVAKAAHASGSVTVEITIDETGNVIAARAVSGHPLLQAAAVKAARQASFKPTRLNGEPVKVAGVLVYNFTAQ